MLATPSDFGGYRVERELGRGGMGGVYLAVDKMLDRPVALKVMRRSLGDDPEFVARFQREAQSAARLSNAHVVQVHAFGRTDGISYIAMEFLGNGSLQQEVKAHPQGIDPIRVMRLGRQIADALACAAAHGLVHGDVKPENVLYADDGTAKLADFGLAAMQKSSRDIWGTPYYISPEKVRGQSIDFRADLYSLGGTLYHALTGVPPFDHADPIALMKLRLRETPKWPSLVRAGIPSEVDVIVMRLLQVDPRMRYPTCQALLEDIDAFLARHAPTKHADAVATAKRPMPVKLVRSAAAKIAQPASPPPPSEPPPKKSPTMTDRRPVTLRHVKKEELATGTARLPKDAAQLADPVRTARRMAPPPPPKRLPPSGGGHGGVLTFLLLLVLAAGAVWYFWYRPKMAKPAENKSVPVRTGSGQVKIIKLN